jgi:hypothetical protein
MPVRITTRIATSNTDSTEWMARRDNAAATQGQP